MPDDEDRPRDASSGADPGVAGGAMPGTEWANLSAPDNISELSRDIKAYRRELRVARRRATFRRLLARPGAAPLTMVLAALTLTAIIAIALTLMDPRDGRSTPAARPLTTAAPATPTLHESYRLPDASLQSVEGQQVRAVDVRPTALALVPLNCGCEDLIDQLSTASVAAQLPMAVVAPLRKDAEVASWQGRLRNASIYYDTSDPSQTLASKLGAKGLTVVVVDRDGTIVSFQKSVTSAPATNLTRVAHQMLNASAING